MIHRRLGRILVDRVDAAGLGAGLVDILSPLSPVPVRSFVGADEPTSPTDQRRYANRRAAAYARLADAIRNARVSLPPDPELATQLGGQTCAHDQRNRLLMARKEQYKADHGNSPDRADAVSMLWDLADPPAALARPRPDADTSEDW